MDDPTGVILAWYASSARDLPWRKDPSPYHALLSEFLLDRTTVEAALPYYALFLDSYPTLHALALAEEDEVLKKWEGLGFYARARHLLACARSIDERGDYPPDYASWRSLPGIGDYMASALSSLLHEDARLSFDGNLLRVLSRAFARDLSGAPAQREVQEAFSSLSKENAGDVNQALMDIGATLCRARPACADCPLSRMCLARAQGTIASFPVRRVPRAKKETSFTALIERESAGSWVLVRREASLLKGLYLPRLYAGTRSAEEVRAALHARGEEVLSLEEAGDEDMVFSHLVWHLHVMRVTVKEARLAPDEVRASERDLSSLPLSRVLVHHLGAREKDEPFTFPDNAL